MAFEYTTDIFKIKRIHNIRDFAYKVELKDINTAELALLLNNLTDEAFFWEEGQILHATSEIDWSSFLPEDLKEKIVAVEKVHEGYLPQSKLPKYTAWALFAADFNKVWTPNFKANPVFRKLRRRTKEGWNLSLWMKFLHEFSLKYKVEIEGLEYQVYRWFGVMPEDTDYLTLSFKGGIIINSTFDRLASKFNKEAVLKYFKFKVRGTYRVGTPVDVDFDKKELKLTFDESENIFTVPFERAFPIYIPENGLDWDEKDRTGLLKNLRLTPKVICHYMPTLVAVINQLLEPYMVQIEHLNPSWEEVKYSPNVVIDKPVNGENPEELLEYIFEERKLYNVPFNELNIVSIDLALKSEKNKKLLRDAKKDFFENLALFFGDIGVKVNLQEEIFDKKIKEWNISSAAEIKEFLNGLREKLEKADYGFVIIPQREKLTEHIEMLPLLEEIKQTLKGLKVSLLTDREIKVFFKSDKKETKRKILFKYIKEIVETNGGAVYILDEPLPFGRVAVEEEDHYRVYNLFGEPVEVVKEFVPQEEDLLITYDPKKVNNNRTVLLDREHAPVALKKEIESGRCLNAEKGISYNLLRWKGYLVLDRALRFGHKTAVGVKVSEDLNLKEVEKALLELSKVREL